MHLDELNLQELWERLLFLSWPKRLLLILGTWVFFAMIGFLFFWKSNLDLSAQLETDIQASLTRLNTQSQLLLDSPVIEAEYAQLQSQLPLLMMALPSERELASLLERINDLILDNGLKLVEFTPQTPLNREVMRVVPVKVSVRGEGVLISQLPNYIASLSRQVSLKEFEMSVMPDSAGWQMTGELNAFAQLPANAQLPLVSDASKEAVKP